MATERLHVQVGMEIVGSDGKHVGYVKECRSTDFLADRRLARDVYVPYDAISDISPECVTLNIPCHDVATMPWARPSL